MKKLRKFTKSSCTWLGGCILTAQAGYDFHKHLLRINMVFGEVKSYLTRKELLAKIHSSAPQGD